VNLVITVNPQPVGVPVTLTTCSDAALGTGVTLATNGTSVSAAHYDISTSVTGGITQSSGTVSAGTNKAAGELIDDAWTNTTGINQTVTYTVTPVSSANCSGTPFTVTITVQPEPSPTPNVASTVCSDVVVGYNLVVPNAATYNITTNAATGLTQSGGTVSAGTGKLAAELADDQWTNISLVTKDVIYTVIPVSAVAVRAIRSR